jgi:hypothetical protein
MEETTMSARVTRRIFVILVANLLSWGVVTREPALILARTEKPP